MSWDWTVTRVLIVSFLVGLGVTGLGVFLGLNPLLIVLNCVIVSLLIGIAAANRQG